MVASDVSVIGLGKLGLCLAACFANRGYDVIGVDVAPRVVRKVNSGESPIYEPGLPELLTSCRKHLTATRDHVQAIEGSRATFVVVPTPSEPDGSFSTAHLQEVMDRVGRTMREKEEFHLIVVTSTVLPGTTRNVLLPILEEASGKKCGSDFGLCYSPLLVALGSVISNILSPDLLMVGESDERSGAILEEMYASVCNNSPPIVRASFESVELAKIGINSFITMKISFANTLAELCEHFPGADADVVSGTIGLDSRIGAKYLRGGLGFGGPCFPRDNRAFVSVARRANSQAPLARATDQVNEHQVRRTIDRVRATLLNITGKTIAVLGITYKPDTNVVEESHALKIAMALLAEGARLRVYDPAGMEAARTVLGNGVEYLSSAEDCLRGADLCLLGTPWDEFKNLRPDDFLEMATPIVFDCWRALNQLRTREKLRYVALGLPEVDLHSTPPLEPLERG